jgi:hypothetical protein
MIENASSAVEQALEIAEGLPEKYQEVGFAEVLRHILRHSSAKASSGASEAATQSGSQSSRSKLEELAESLPDAYLVAEGTRAQQVIWAVVELSMEGEEATRESVGERIEIGLSITPPHPNNISTLLGDLCPRHLTREKREDGKGYAYRPTSQALEIFEGLGE